MREMNIDPNKLNPETARLFREAFGLTRYKIKYCTNKQCLAIHKKKEEITCILKTKKGKKIPICMWVKLDCPDAKWHYFHYKPEVVSID